MLACSLCRQGCSALQQRGPVLLSGSRPSISDKAVGATKLSCAGLRSCATRISQSSRARYRSWRLKLCSTWKPAWQPRTTTGPLRRHSRCGFHTSIVPGRQRTEREHRHVLDLCNASTGRGGRCWSPLRLSALTAGCTEAAGGGDLAGGQACG